MKNMRRGLVAASLFGLFLASIAGLGWRGRGAPRTTPTARVDPASHGDDSAPDVRARFDPELVDKTVAFWEKRVRRDPEGFIERRDLAAAYLTRFRERGDIADAVKAENAALASLRILPRNNSSAMLSLARSLLAQHRFPEALDVAQAAAQYDPQGIRLVVDIQMELGNVREAEHALADIPREQNDLNDLALRARLEQIKGTPEVALRLWKQAEKIADDRPDMPAEIVAWHHAMVGHALVDTGRLDEGQRECLSALKIFPRDYRAMTILTAIAVLNGDWKGAVEWGQNAIAIAPQNPEAIKLLGDAFMALGFEKDAERQYQALEKLAHSFPRIYDRHWAMFCAENGRDLEVALALARKDLELRHDVHAYDTLAWVCFQQGMQTEADSAMKKALEQGTREAMLFMHAGMIARAVGDATRAKGYFTQARDINPHVIPLRWLRWIEAGDG